MMQIPFFLTLYAGFTHAFETDHLLAVSNIVTRRDQTLRAVKDGLYWGLGHSSTILLTGVLVLVLKFQVNETYFSYFEGAVGLMLIALGIYRLLRWRREKNTAPPIHTHVHADGKMHTGMHAHSYRAAYQVGLVHGLAGSGSLMLLVMSQSESVSTGLLYLLIFGIGSVAGMMLAAGVFSLPFSQKMFRVPVLQAVLVFLSATLCIGYGAWIAYQHLI